MRNTTGLPLEFAHNCTVARKNIDGVPDIIRWFLAEPKRTQLWRMLSFQPEADTGRTIFSEQPITPELVWEKIQQGTGLPVRRDASIFGHPDCNSWASILVSQRTGTFSALLPDDPTWDAIFGQAMERIGGLSLVNDDAGTPPFRLLGVLTQNPGFFARAVAYLAQHIGRGRLPAHLLMDALRGKAHTLGVGMHNFMDAAMVARAEEDPVIKSRLDSCVFKGAVKQDGEWVAVPMCKMNEAKWSEVYAKRLAVAGAEPKTSNPDRPIPNAEGSETPAASHAVVV
jgi:hypothetical protein